MFSVLYTTVISCLSILERYFSSVTPPEVSSICFPVKWFLRSFSYLIQGSKVRVSLYRSCNSNESIISCIIDGVLVFVILTILLCLSLFVGLGDGWGQTTRFNPLDSMAKELGSHLLQVSIPRTTLLLQLNCCFICIIVLYVIACCGMLQRVGVKVEI